MIQLIYDYLGITDPSPMVEMIVTVSSIMMAAFGALVVLNVTINLMYSVFCGRRGD